MHIKKSTPAFQSPGVCRGCGMVLWAPWGRDGLPWWHQALTKTQQELGASFSQVSRRRSSVCPKVVCWCKCSVWKNARQEERPFPGLPCAEKENGWDEAWRGGTLLSQWGILPENSRRSSSAGITEKKKKKKIWQEIQPGRWSTSFWANWMFQLKMTELRSFKSSQNLINFSWMEAARILKTWQTLCSLEIICSPGSTSSWHQMALPAMDQREKKSPKKPTRHLVLHMCAE